MGIFLFVFLGGALATGVLIREALRFRRAQSGSVPTPSEREPRVHDARTARIHHSRFTGFFIVYVTTAVIWLLVGLTPAIADSFPSLHQSLHSAGRGSDLLSQVARNVADASHDSDYGIEILLDYLFSALNLGLAVFLFRNGPRQAAARLLAVGMVGTAVAFNLQGHLALEVFPAGWGGAIDWWHNIMFHVLSGISYVFALLLFPDGHFVSRRRMPYLIFISLAMGLLSIVAIGDHTVGLVLLFGIVTPIVGINSQWRRFHHSSSSEARQQSKLILAAMTLSFVGASLLIVVTQAITGSSEALAQTTREYEFLSPEAGTYLFVCDPHLEMQGTVRVVDDPTLPKVQSISAEGSEFNKDTLTIPANEDVIIQFTNKDGDKHNVAIYRSTVGSENPVLKGRLFSGSRISSIFFRAFRVFFAVIPIALFVGILRFRLWDIDHIINRALVYTTLTGVLGLFYLASIVLLSRIVRAVPGAEGNDFAIVASTLGAATLFRPLRHRIQGFIDRRFYRRRYNASQTLVAFSLRIRDQVQLDSMTDDLLQVVHETMDPAHVSIWIRERFDPSEH